MNNSDEKKIEYFVALCDDLISCKFLVAESKIQKLLVALAETQPIYELVSDCMEQFNRDREMNKAFLTDGKGTFYVNMPTEEYKIIALVFCTLADIDHKKIDFTDFIKRFFDDEEGVNCYTSFARRMILPFRELIAEAFGLAKRYTTIKPEEEKVDVKPQTLEENVEHNEIDDLFDRCKNLAKEMRDQMYLYVRHDNDNTFKLRYILPEVEKACENKDVFLLFALSVGVDATARSIKNIRFLLKEFDECVDLLCDYTEVS